MGKTVSEVARLSGISVRTLHHYDELGLVSPADRTEAGYRLYGEAEILRLHEVLTWRSLGFPLREIQELLDDPDQDRLEALFVHRRHLVEQVGELHAKIAALDEAIRKASQPEPLEDVDFASIFDGFDPAAFELEAEAQWGDTPAWAESKRRTARYGETEWRAIRDEKAEVERRFLEAMQQGAAPGDPAAADAADAHRAHIERWFYPLTPEIHRGLGEMYVTDPRFRANYDALGAGLADFVNDAIQALYRRERRL